MQFLLTNKENVVEGWVEKHRAQSRCGICLGSAAFLEHCNGIGRVKIEALSVGGRPQVVLSQASVHLGGGRLHVESHDLQTNHCSTMLYPSLFLFVCVRLNDNPLGC